MRRIESMVQDARHALRAMRKAPTFSITVIVTLALGIGVNAAAVAVAYGLLVRPLPYRDPARVVILNLLFPDGGDLGFSPGAVRDWLPRLRTADAAAAYFRREVTVRSGDRSTVVPAAIVTDQFFDVLGTPARHGQAQVRTGSPELVIGARSVARILSARDGQVVGLPITVSDRSHTIGGVMPEGVAFPDDAIGLWLPSPVLLSGTRAQDSGYSKIIIRLKPGVTMQELRADANRVRLELNPSSREGVSLVVLGESVVAGMRPLLLAAVAGALLVLLVACANVATLFIGRDVARERETAARMAVGATGFQLVRGVIIETLLFAVAASVVGVGLGSMVLKMFVTGASGTVSGLHRVVMDFPVVIAIAGLTILVTMLCSIVPAWHAARSSASPFLRIAAGARPRAWRVRRALVVAQVACSCVLLIGAGLLLRTVQVLMQEDHGFEPARALEAKVVLSDTFLFNGPRADTFVSGLLERVRAMPGVQHAGFGSNLPPRTPLITMSVRFKSDERDESRFMKVGSATPGYLRALGVRFLSGRDFDVRDDHSAVPVVILSESAARFHFPGVDAVGRTIPRLPALFNISGNPLVIGVVSDIKYDGLDAPAGSAIYLPWKGRPLRAGYLIVRTAGDPLHIAPEIRRAAQAVDPAVPVPELQSLEDALAQSIASRRVRAMPAIGFGVLAVVMSFVGVLATLSTLVAERRRDLAIRSALGAAPGTLMWAIMRQGLMLTAVGLAIGLGAGGVAARGLSAFLYRVGPFDVMTFAGAVALIVGLSALTTYVAAARTRRIDPLVVLRHE
jgi:putative ABC transport system permease protein